MTVQALFNRVQRASYVVLVALLAGCGSNTATVPATDTPGALSTPAVATSAATEAPKEVPTTLVTPSAIVTSEAAPATPTYVPTSQVVYPTPEPHLSYLGEPNISPAEAREIIAGRAAEVIQALKSRDMERLAQFAHPETGVRFSPYPSVGNMDQGLTPAELRKGFADDTVRVWGWYDGSGKPMEMTFSEYYDEFVYNQDFAAAPSVTYNEFKGQGNTVNNIFAEYPDGITVEYHFPGFSPQYQGSDWESLYLVFQEHTDGNWYLAHIAHGYWTI